MTATQLLRINIVNCGGMRDIMSEQESMFLQQALPLFRAVHGQGRATPRANASMTRVYNTTELFNTFDGKEHVMHLVAHGTSTKLQTGNGKSDVTTQSFTKKAVAGAIKAPEIIVSTACDLQSPDWRSAFAAAGAKVLIAADAPVSPANLAAFDMAFYSALLSQVRKNKSLIERVEASFELAKRHYADIHASGNAYAKFRLFRL